MHAMNTDTPCKCWNETEAKLREKGYRLADSLSAIQWTQSGPMKVTRMLPIMRSDHAKLKKTDPKSITISHCPFCGQKYGQDT